MVAVNISSATSTTPKISSTPKKDISSPLVQSQSKKNIESPILPVKVTKTPTKKTPTKVKIEVLPTDSPAKNIPSCLKKSPKNKEKLTVSEKKNVKFEKKQGFYFIL